MEGPANTTVYFIAGYGVIFGLMAFYLATLVIRWRNLRQDEEMLQNMEEEGQQVDTGVTSYVDS
jgi:hypothetical protein